MAELPSASPTGPRVAEDDDIGGWWRRKALETFRDLFEGAQRGQIGHGEEESLRRRVRVQLP